MVGEYKSWPQENGYRYILKNGGDLAIINKTGKLQSIGAWRLITSSSKRKGRMIKYEPVKCSNNDCADMGDLRTNVLYLYKKRGKVFIEMGSYEGEEYGIIKLEPQ
ncbi:hypothetical protein [Deinococcus puniceus]|uniref:hypothetical protein n=1 Tax=Deinococcus puniceus TaxID=1182568 RepID=UPI0012F946DE|nr:hypothetical protein [Deinococcus puniceus]